MTDHGDYTWEMFYADLLQAMASAGGLQLTNYHTFPDLMAQAYKGRFGESGAWAVPETFFFAVFNPRVLAEGVAQAENQRINTLQAIIAGLAAQKMAAAGALSSPCNSFSSNTLVTTDEGVKTISTLQVGDKVLAWNQATGETGYYTVAATHSHLDPILVYLTLDGETILTTPEHPFYTVAGEWVGAGNLQVGSRVYATDNHLGVVEAVKVVEQPQVMYNLTVDQAHTFAVGDGQWLVHNGDCITTVEDIVASASPGRSTKGRTQQYTVSGNMETANKDFDALNLDKVAEIPGVGRRGVDTQGRTVIVRSRSTYGAPTIEVQYPNSGRKIEVRYE